MPEPSQQFHDFIHRLNAYGENLRVAINLNNKTKEILDNSVNEYNMLKDRADRIARQEGICVKELCQDRQFDKEDVHKQAPGEW